MIDLQISSVNILLLFLFTLPKLIITNDHHEKQKYTKKAQWSHYLESIDEAVANYEDCINDEKCSCFSSVIDADLQVWKDKGNITKQDVSYAKQHGVHYQIINHKLYRQDSCMFQFRCRQTAVVKRISSELQCVMNEVSLYRLTDRCKGVEHFLLGLLDQLPDMDLIINDKDWPQIPKTWEPLPVFSFSKVPSHNWDIMYPAWTFWEGGPAVWPIYPTGLGRWDLQRDIISKEAVKWPWHKKRDKGFFRGSRTSAERDPLIILSRKEPALVDAQYTKNQAWKSDADTLHKPPAKEIPLEDHCPYKYLFNFRGVAASFRFKHLFMCNSTVFHVGDQWLEFFYTALKPWVHYVPVKADLSDVKDLLLFAKDHQKEMQGIAERGRKFIKEHLRMEDVICYWKQLLLTYASLLEEKPKKEPNFHQIRS